VKFMDPMSVTCERCATESHQAVADLLRLRAACPTCRASFAETGLRMREMIDDWDRFVTSVEIAMLVEPIIGHEIPDAELTAVKSLRDFAGIVQSRTGRPEAESVRFVVEAARTIDGCTQRELDLDATLLNAIHPDRWPDS